MNTIFYTLGVVVGAIMRRVDIAFEWFADGYNSARFCSEPKPPAKPRKPLIDLDALRKAAKSVRVPLYGSESHAETREPVSGTTTSTES